MEDAILSINNYKLMILKPWKVQRKLETKNILFQINLLQQGTAFNLKMNIHRFRATAHVFKFHSSLDDE